MVYGLCKPSNVIPNFEILVEILPILGIGVRITLTS